jgi:hypothetical protein
LGCPQCSTRRLSYLEKRPYLQWPGGLLTQP